MRLLSERYSTGQQIDKRRIVVHGDGPFALVALLAAALDDDIAGAVGTGFVASLEELLVESPRITPMVFPFRALETYDVPDLVRLAAPRPSAGARGDDAADARGRRPGRGGSRLTARSSARSPTGCSRASSPTARASSARS